MKAKHLISFSIVLALACSSCHDDTEVARYESPQGTYDAVVIYRRSGATSINAYHLFIIYKYWPVPEEVGWFEWAPNIRMCWASNTNLRIYNIPADKNSLPKSFLAVTIDVLEEEPPESIQTTCPPLPDIE